MIFGAVGSGAVGSLIRRLPIAPKIPEGLSSHPLAPNIARWNVGVNETVSHVVGGAEGMVNQIIRPDAPNGIPDLMAAGAQGFFLGSDGPTAGIHRAR
jgi:hypothetical protein